MITDIKIVNNLKNPITSGIFLLPGRGCSAEFMANFFKEMNLPHTIGIALQPHDFEWYPMPNGPKDQKKSLAGIPAAIKAIEKHVGLFSKTYNLSKDKIALVGFSAGAVMALQTMAYSKESYLAAVSLGGAILEPKLMPPCNVTTHVLLQHNFDDFCFDWYERYIPMYDCLVNNKYDVHTLERYYGNHNITRTDAIAVAEYLSLKFGYFTWTHPAIERYGSQLYHLDERIEVKKISKVREFVKNRLDNLKKSK